MPLGTLQHRSCQLGCPQIHSHDNCMFCCCVSAAHSEVARQSVAAKRFLLQSVFHTAWLRHLFPGEAFKGVTMHNLDGMELQMLQPVDDETRRMIQWIETDVSKAVSQNYLHRLHFVVSKDVQGQDLIEQYTYTFKYGKDGAHSQVVEQCLSCCRKLDCAGEAMLHSHLCLNSRHFVQGCRAWASV
jgi:HORMA domain